MKVKVSSSIMRIDILYLLVVFIVTVVRGEIGENKKRIVGGVEAIPGRYSYMTALVAGSEHFCGGALITDQWVLTAAHCRGYGTHVMIGRTDLGSNIELYERIPIEYEVVHPRYNSNTNEHDILLVKLIRPSRIPPVSVDDGSNLLLNGLEVTVMGWGTTCYGGPQSSKLLEVQVDVLDHNTCNRQYSGSITQDMICAMRQGKDACQGDSGGPLIVKGASSSNDILVGIVSWGNGCAEPSYAGVYSRVSAHYDWISLTTSGTRTFTNREILDYKMFHYSKRLYRSWKRGIQKKNPGLRYFDHI